MEVSWEKVSGSNAQATSLPHRPTDGGPWSGSHPSVRNGGDSPSRGRSSRVQEMQDGSGGEDLLAVASNGGQRAGEGEIACNMDGRAVVWQRRELRDERTQGREGARTDAHRHREMSEGRLLWGEVLEGQAGQDRTGQDRTGQDRTEQDRTGSVRGSAAMPTTTGANSRARQTDPPRS